MAGPDASELGDRREASEGDRSSLAHEAAGTHLQEAAVGTVTAIVDPEPIEVGIGSPGLGVGGWLAAGWLVAVVLAAVLAPLLPIAEANETFPAAAREGPSADHLLGTDAIGRDVLARVIWGGRASLIVGIAAVLFGLLVGGFLGLIAGYFRGRTETALVSLFDIMLAFPQLVLALALVAVFATGAVGEPVSSGRRLAVLILALGIVSVPILGRITRANAIVWSQREFVVAARAMGAPHHRIILREVLPNVVPAMASISLLGVAVAIVAEGGLSVLGVGVQLPTPSWGNLIAEGRSLLRNSPHVVFAPSVAIFLTVLALNHLGDVIRARFDVRETLL